MGVDEEVVNETVCGLFEVVAEFVENLFLQLDVCFECDVRRAVLLIKEAPARPAEIVVDQDSGFGFGVHTNHLLDCTAQKGCERRLMKAFLHSAFSKSTETVCRGSPSGNDA